jgi:hypothetical protein
MMTRTEFENLEKVWWKGTACSYLKLLLRIAQCYPDVIKQLLTFNCSMIYWKSMVLESLKNEDQLTSS